MAHNPIKHALDNTLSSLFVSEQDASQLLALAKGGKKVKRKLSVAMVLAIVMVTLTATAIAATLIWKNYVVDIKKKEQTQGKYANWEITSKKDLVKSLMDMGYIPQSEQTRQLFDAATEKEQQDEIADILMLALTKMTDTREINADIITYAVFGPEATWTSEQRVWWQQVTNLFRNAAHDLDSFVLAGAEDFPEEQAIAVAREAIEKAFNLPKGALDKARPVADLYVTKARPTYRRWMVQFQFIKAGTENYLEKEYYAVVDSKGNIIADPDVGIPHVDEMAITYKNRRELTDSTLAAEYYALSDRAGNPNLQWWSLESKAEFSRNMRDRILTALEEGRIDDLKRGEYPVMVMIAAAHYVYGLPDEQVISQEVAFDAAKIAMRERFGYAGEALESFDRAAIYYDVTDIKKPLWRFVLMPQQRLGMMIYRIEIDAKTGEVSNAEAIKSKPFNLNMEELPHYLKIL